MSSYATYNLKGGVGKTAAAVNLAYEASREGRRTLLWDLDPQGAASFYFRIEAGIEAGVDDGRIRWLDKKKALRQTVVATDYDNLDLLPARFAYRHLDLDLNDRKHPENSIARRLATVREDYDVVIIDCAPSLSLVSESVFNAVDWLLIPLIPTPLSLRAYDQLLGYRATQRDQIAQPLPYFSMVDRRRNLHRATILEFVAQRPEVLRSYIPYASEIERMGSERAPVGAFAAGAPGGRAFHALWQVIKARQMDANG